MTKKQFRQAKKDLLRRRYVAPTAVEPVPPTKTPKLSPQDELLLKELRSFAADINTVLVAVEQRFHARALVQGMTAARTESAD